MPIINQVVSGGGGSAPAHYIEKIVDANGKLVNGGTSVIDMTGVTDVGDNVLQNAYKSATLPANTLVDFSALTAISGTSACESMFYQSSGIITVDLSGVLSITHGTACQNMFYGCTGITSLDLSSLTTINYGGNICNSMFYGCTGITSLDLSSLITVDSYNGCNSMFRGCTGLTSVNLSSLTTIGSTYACSYMFYGCTGITNITLSSLTSIDGNALTNTFSWCTNLTTLSFPCVTTTSFGATSALNYMLSSVTGCVIHFPSNAQATVEALTGYPNFGGTNTTVLFDLPATNTLTGADTVTYTRNPKYDTATALAWKVGAYGTTNFTPAYYTSGTTDPVVGDTIYSDAACTTAVTTISAIA